MKNAANPGTGETVAGQYDRWAETYAYMYGTPDKGVDYFKNTIGRKAADILQKGARILDVGCGVGLSTAGLLEHEFEVVGVDISKKSLAASQDILRPYAGRFELIHGDARDLSLFAGGFDAAVAMSSLCEHMLDPTEQKAVIAGIAAAIKPGGRVFIDSYDYENIIASAPDDDIRYATIAQLPEGPGVYFERRRYKGYPRSRNFDTDYHLIDSGGRLMRLSIPGRAVFLREYTSWLEQCGLVDVEVLRPDETGLHKHLCTARRPEAHETLGDDSAPRSTAAASAPEQPHHSAMAARILPQNLPPNIFEEPPDHRSSILHEVRKPTGERVLGRRRQVTLVMFSGGVDSTYSLVKLLRESQDEIVAHHIHFLNGEGRQQAESTACGKIFEHLKKTERGFFYTESVIDRTRFKAFGQDVISAGFEAGMVSSSFFADRSHIIDRWTSGICMEEELDDFGIGDAEETTHMLNATAAGAFPNQPPRFFQLPIITKRRQMEYMGPELTNLCWTCRRPVSGPDDAWNECGECKTCLVMNEIRAGLPTIAERPAGP